LRFGGTDKVSGLLVAGVAEEMFRPLEQLWERINRDRGITLVLATSDEILRLALDAIPKNRTVILGPDSIVNLLESAEPWEELRRYVRSQIPLRRSIPLDIAAFTDHLEKGWRAGHAQAAKDFAHRWSDRLASSLEIVEIRDNMLHFTAD